jgi:hypothetical protein
VIIKSSKKKSFTTMTHHAPRLPSPCRHVSQRRKESRDVLLFCVYLSIGVVDANNGAMLAEIRGVRLGDDSSWKRVPLIFTATVASVKLRVFQIENEGQVYIDDVSICEIA